MKKLIAITLTLMLALSVFGCASDHDHDHDHDQAPQYNTVTGSGDYTLYVNGTFVDTFANNVISVETLQQTIGGSIEYEQVQTAPYTCRFRCNDTVYDYTDGVDGIVYDGTNWYVPYTVLDNFDLNRYENGNNLYYTDYPLATEVTKDVDVPVLMYHAVSDNMWGIESLFVSPSELRKQLEYLKDNNYTTITFEDLDNLENIEKPVMLTFDDGYEDNYTELFPLLQEFNMKATIFVITGEIGKQHYLIEQQIGEMSASGLVSIQSHTVTHPYLSDITEAELDTELSESKNTLARITGKEPFVLCYPTGKYSDLSLEKTKQYYQFGVLMNGGTYETDDNPVKVERHYVSRSTTVDEFADMID